MIIASPLIGPALPVIGFSGILVIIYNNIKTTVPAIPIEYHILLHCLTRGTTQNRAIPPTKNKISGLPISSPILIVSINLFICSIPAIKVVAAAAAESSIVTFLLFLYLIGNKL
jgi:hypothetical protein